jgi:predicted enzyme related to lactoylglutathione lyase
MPTRDTAPTGAPCWIDLQTSDPQRARTFYTELFGWTAQESSEEFGGYFMFTADDKPVAGAMPSDEQAPITDVWSIYLATPDAAKTLQFAADRGGQVIVEPMPVADLGTMGFLMDPGQAAIGVWQPDQFPGFLTLGEPATPAWFELLTRDYARSIEFYKDVFGWTTSVMGDTDEFRYTVSIDPAAGDEGQLAGVMDAASWLPEGVPSHWSVYFATEDTDLSASRVTELGGSVVEPPTDTPYGRMTRVTDPMGAHFKLIGPNTSTPAG